MRTLVLFEDEGVEHFQPLTLWRTLFELRVGRHIILDRTAQRLGLPVGGVWTRPLLARVAAMRCGAPVNEPLRTPALLVNGRWLPDESVAIPDRNVVGRIGKDVAYVACGGQQAPDLTADDLYCAKRRESALRGWEQINAPGRMLRYPWDILEQLTHLLEMDWHPNQARWESAIDARCHIVNEDRIYVGPSSAVHPTAVLDASAGPIYVSHHVTIGAHAVLEGPMYVGSGTKINPHAWLHGGNAFGPVCRIGGEVHGCVIHGYSNKHHHGFLGHSVVGSWVNLGAGCCNSDLKNTYGSIKVPLRGPDQPEVDTGRTFFGTLIGDHAKIGINAVIPTGAIVGFAAMTATGRVLPRWIPPFAWVTDDETTKGDVGRLLDVARKVMARRSVDMTAEEADLFRSLAFAPP